MIRNAMKKGSALVLALVLLLLAGCGGAEAPAESETTRAPTETTETAETTAATEPTETEPPVPETVRSSVKADRTAVMLTTANRGDILDVVGEYDENHYVVKLENGYGLIEKRLARLDSEASYEQWTGYAFYGAKLYPDYRLRGEALAQLSINQQVTVLDSLGDVLVVQIGETIGYIQASQVSAYYIAPVPGGSGGNGDGIDGGDISLSFRGGITLLGTFVPQEGEVDHTAAVLADGAPILLGWLHRNETVELVKEEGFAEEREGYYTVYLDGICGYVQQNLIAQADAEPYEEWDGYAIYGAKLYDNFDLTGEPVQVLHINAKMHVISDLGNCYLVTVGETSGYVDKEYVSEHFIVYGGGSCESGESGGNGESGGSSGGEEWSPPAL